MMKLLKKKKEEVQVDSEKDQFIDKVVDKM